MEKTTQTKFYVFGQNNSGGYFIRNDDVDENVVIEAITIDDAKGKFWEVVVPHSESCSCCGDRWSDYMCDEFVYDELADIKVQIYSRHADKSKAIIYFVDGTKKSCQVNEYKNLIL